MIPTDPEAPSQPAGGSPEAEPHTPAAKPAEAAAKTPEAGLSLAAMAGLEAEASTGDGRQEQCSNCHVPLHGPFCHRCGQPTRHFIRFFPVVVNEVMVDSLGIDGRFWRTLWALLLRPGRLTLDYLSGRRVHYSPPIRLYLFSSLLAFLIITSLVDDAIDANLVEIQDGKESQELLAQGDEPEVSKDTAAARSDAEQARQVKAQVAEELRRQGITPPAELLAALDRVDRQAAIPPQAAPTPQADPVDENAHQLTISAELSALPTPDPPPVVAEEDEATLVLFGNEPWDAEKNPLELPFLSASMNQRLNSEIAEFKERLPEIKKNPRILVDRILEILPQAMFLMLPAFALLMKLFYAFSRRYYMEHLLFALHSHAFVYAMVSLMALTSWAHDWFSPGKDWDAVKSSVDGLAQLWLFVYLFLAQKRVYRQGWIMTTVKFFTVGICYSVLLSLGMVVASLVGVILV